MKKSILVLLSIIVMSAVVGSVSAKVAPTNSATSAAIKAYKSGNYTSAYSALTKIVNDDPSNALAYYYLAMTNVQLGMVNDAIQNYDVVMRMSPNGVLGSYAKKGKKCIETADKCNEPEVQTSTDTDEDRFIKGIFGSGFSKEARGEYEKQKIENLKREINRRDELTPQQFKDYKDFSSEVPTNDEIVNAIRTLQRAGMSDVFGNSYGSEISAMLGENNSNRAGYDMLNMMFQNKGGMSNLSPQVIQSLLTSQMTTGF
jgi:tetratricopeptide (TPR) repeat protein